MLNEVYIVAAKRSPIGSFGGKLKSLSAVQLATEVVKDILVQTQIDHSKIDEMIMGNVISAGLGQNPAKQVLKNSGLKDSIISYNINKVCASGLKAVGLAFQTIQLQQAQSIIAGGMESMSNAPFLNKNQRWGKKLGHIQLLDSIICDGLTDAYNKQPMGNCGEICANEYGFSRDEQDLFSILSYKKAIQASESGYFAKEITPIEITEKNRVEKISLDEEPFLVQFDKIPQLKPVFAKDGTITAANASKNSDGAAVLLLMSAAEIKNHNLTPLAKIVGFADAETSPEKFTIAPSLAVEKLLLHHKLTTKDIDFWECNEAFAVVAQANQKRLQLDPDKLNMRGGAVALGHPIGCSGARILVSLIHILRDHNGKFGMATICNGGGGASAMLIQKM